ncbi:MAG: hypothetical protein IJ996_05850 [Clostridia bacterium]|nr:hypothetical protein [Clostridia bacterium]
MSKKYLARIMGAVLSLSTLLSFAGCGGGETDLAKKYGVDKSNLYGFFEPLWEKRADSTEDQIKCFDLDVTIDLMEAMGCSSIRFYIPSKVFNAFMVDYESGEVEVILDETLVEYFHEAATKLKNSGIDCLVGESIVFPPFRSDSGVSTLQGMLNVPQYNVDEAYAIWMQAVEEAWKTLTAEFPEVTIWEMGNEYNTDNYFHPVTYDKETGTGGFSVNEMVATNLDYMYYANKGIKAGNPNAVSLTPGYTSGGQMKSRKLEYFYDDLYAGIQSGAYPRVGTKTTNTNDFFGGLAYHPYNFSGWDDKFVEYNNDIYEVVTRYGDIGKKVYFTEVGWYDDFSNSKIQSQTEAIKKLYSACKNDMWYVESCLYFRFYNCEYDWSGGGAGNAEKTFGVFYEPDYTQQVGFLPKPKAEAMKEIFGGTGDLSMWSNLTALQEKVANSRW